MKRKHFKHFLRNGEQQLQQITAEGYKASVDEKKSAVTWSELQVDVDEYEKTDTVS